MSYQTAEDTGVVRFTVKEVAQILDMSERGVRYMISQNRLKGFKLRVGKQKSSMKVAKHDLIEYLKNINPDRSDAEIEKLLFG